PTEVRRRSVARYHVEALNSALGHVTIVTVVWNERDNRTRWRRDRNIVISLVRAIEARGGERKGAGPGMAEARSADAVGHRYASLSQCSQGNTGGAHARAADWSGATAHEAEGVGRIPLVGHGKRRREARRVRRL